MNGLLATEALALATALVALERTNALLREALELAEEGWAYADDYFDFEEKHEGTRRIEALREELVSLQNDETPDSAGASDASMKVGS